MEYKPGEGYDLCRSNRKYLLDHSRFRIDESLSLEEILNYHNVEARQFHKTFLDQDVICVHTALLPHEETKRDELKIQNNGQYEIMLLGRRSSMASLVLMICC